MNIASTVVSQSSVQSEQCCNRIRKKLCFTNLKHKILRNGFFLSLRLFHFIAVLYYFCGFHIIVQYDSDPS